MTWIFQKILSMLSGGLLEKIIGAYAASKDAETEIEAIRNETIVVAIQAEVAQRAAVLKQREIDRGWWVTRWLPPLLAYPVALYLGAIFMDSIFDFEYTVLRVPEELQPVVSQIVGFYFLGSTVERVAKVIKG